MLITPEYAKLNAKLHQTDDSYGAFGGEAATLAMFADQIGTKDILDYGCGKGRLGKMMPWPIKEYDPAIPGKEASPEPADIVICRDVLEHIEPQCINDVLHDLARCVKRVGIFSIATGPSWDVLPDGRNAHVLQRSAQWWKDKLSALFVIDSINEISQVSGKGAELFIGGSTVFVTVKPKPREPMRIFIGYDPKETVAYHVLSHSILKRAATPVAITPLVRRQLPGVYTRPRSATESTEFSMTRFLVPYLSGYKGYSVFMDCDMVCCDDITKLMDYVRSDPDKAVWVCPHDYTPKTQTKFLGQIQTKYPRKNWSSLMIFNNEACQALTPDYVNTASGLDLHRFAWIDDQKIGFLPLEWNWLVGEYEVNDQAKILHYTIGTPCFEEGRFYVQANVWWKELKKMEYPIEQ